MAEVDAKDIEALRAEPEIERRVLNFLNRARRLEDMARLERLDPGNEIRQQLLARRRSVGPFGYAGLKQLAGLQGLSIEWLKKLLELFGRVFYGQWDILYDTQRPDGTPVSVAHAALLRTGWVLFFEEATTFETILWDSSDEATPKFEFPVNQPGDALFCAGHSFLSDGRLLAVGGGGGGPANVNRAWKFDPIARTWEKTTGDMNHARWYPTAVTLGDERRVLVVGGSPNTSKVEVYDEYGDTFTPVTLPVERAFPQLYPGLHLLPGGEVFYTRTGFGFAGPGPGGGDPSPGTPYLRFSGPTAGEWRELENPMEHADRVRGMSVLLLDPCDPVVRVMIVGGGSAPGAETAEIVRLSTLTPMWEMPTIIPGGSDRRNVNAVLLPDGTVFVCGGTVTPDVPCALYDPATSGWAEMAELNYRKQYHSVAILLPSGKVMATGGANFGGGSTAIEVFSPPYLFKGPRPGISSAPALVHHGHTFDLGTPHAAHIERVVLVRPAAVTHQTDTEQRVLQMKFTRHGNVLKVTAPDHHHPHLAQRGYYLLFVLNDNGVPSEGKFIFLH